MADKIKVDQLAKTINDFLEEYQDVVEEALVEAVDRTAADTVQDLKNTSPKDTGAYAKGWTQTKEKGSARQYGKIVYNKPHYRLTHLLEYGHAKVNGGCVAARPHIAAAETRAIDDFERRLKEGIEHAAQ